jgi:Flp pilus assembly protein TadD
VQFALAASCERIGQFERAEHLFRRLIAREPENSTALNYLGYMYADSGVMLAESLKLIERALAVDSTNGAYLDSYGWALYRLGRLPEAEAQIRKALVVMQSDATILDHLGDILLVLGRRDEAEAQWRKALELEPDNAAIRRKLGM